MTLEPVSCVPEKDKGNTRIVAHVTGGSPVPTAKVYFHASGIKDDHYLEMRRAENGDFWAMLPLPESDTKTVQYKVVAMDGAGQKGSSDVVTVPVTKACSVTMTPEEKKFADNLVVGLTLKGQDGRPPGFICKGVVAQLTSDCDLRPVEACLFPPAPWFWWAGTAAALAGGVIAITSSEAAGLPLSPSRPPVR